ncbi:neprilysin-2-like [Chironomus tepperi]|uniref:neprilysin-2-like n=1 Tax=Chironomus tepperi TaxID=113505 RepID=UPI00391FC2F0
MLLLLKISLIFLLNSAFHPVTAYSVRNFRNIDAESMNLTASPNSCDDICLTRGCIITAAVILEKIDENLDPCDDFYTFSCNRYINNTFIPDDQTQIDVFVETHEKLQERIKAIITAPIDDNEIEPFKNMKRLYRACMNKALIEERGLKPMTDVLEKEGGWPVVMGGTWDGSDWSWTDTQIHLNKQGYTAEYLFKFKVDNDYKNITKYIIRIDQPNLQLEREQFLEEFESQTIQDYHKYQVDLAILYGAKRICAELQMREVLEFEVKLARIVMTKEERTDFNNLYHLMSIKELQAKYPFMDWLNYFNSILPDVSRVTKDEIINVSVPKYLEDLGRLLENTPKRTIANYIFWCLTSMSSSFLSQDARNLELEYMKSATGQLEDEPRWKECMNYVSKSYSIATGALYVRKYFNHDSKETVQDMMDMIKAKYDVILRSVEWMDDQTKQSALLKLKNMLTNIAYPNELMDDNKLVDYYGSVTVDETKFYESLFNVQKYSHEQDLKDLRETYSKSDWKNWFGAAVIDAYYDLTKNVINFPAGIFQGRFFSHDRPAYMNYGAIGTVMGHEMTHAFDNQGKRFDSDGTLANWWKNETMEAYIEKENCIKTQYGNYSEPTTKLYLDGVNTLGENIADNGGVRVAYQAYQKFVDKNGPEKKLPGLKYTPNQLFWISGAQVWCSVYRPETIKQSIETSIHSPGQFRVLGPFRNLEEFSKDFNCPKGSPMNPVHKCEIF